MFLKHSFSWRQKPKYLWEDTLSVGVLLRVVIYSSVEPLVSLLFCILVYLSFSLRSFKVCCTAPNNKCTLVFPFRAMYLLNFQFSGHVSVWTNNVFSCHEKWEEECRGIFFNCVGKKISRAFRQTFFIWIMNKIQDE